MFCRAIYASNALYLAMACAGCDDGPAPIIDYSCNESGLVDGNASISGFPPLDAFFSSVLAFGRMSDLISRALAADLHEIQATFQISDEQVAQAGSLSAALEALLDQSLSGDLEMVATPARCPVDTQGVLMAELACKALAECEVDSDLGTLEATCSGTCSDAQSEMPRCEAGAAQSCTRFGASLPCSGMCVGTCLEGGTASSMVTLDCEGRCNGECTSATDEGSCAKDATVSCATEGADEVTCASTCDGEVTAMAGAPCPATPICQTSTSADATLHALCTFPLVELSYDLDPALDEATRTKVDVSVERLRIILPRILTALRQAEGVLRAGSGLSVAAMGSVSKAIDDVVDHGGLPFEVLYKVSACAPGELRVTSALVAAESNDLEEQVRAAQELSRVLRLED